MQSGAGCSFKWQSTFPICSSGVCFFKFVLVLGIHKCMWMFVCLSNKMNFLAFRKKIKQINTNNDTNDRHLTLSNHCCSAALQGKPHPKATDFSQKLHRCLGTKILVPKCWGTSMSFWGHHQSALQLELSGAN